MIFDTEYDNALWFILRADKKNRKEIVDFIKEIPRKLLENIRTAIELHKFDELEEVYGDQTNKFFSCESENDSNLIYYFQVNEDIYTSLRVRKVFYNGDIKEELFDMILFPVSREKIDALPSVPYQQYAIPLGTIKTNIKTQNITGQIQSIAYNIYRTPSFDYVVYGIDRKKEDEITFVKLMDDKIPKDISVKKLHLR